MFSTTGDQDSPSALQNGLDGNVIFHVAGQAVDLVNHDRLHVPVALDPREHLLELRTVLRPG